MTRIIDADGHINDYAYGDEIAKYMPKGNQSSVIFPVLDHLHYQYLRKNRDGMGNPGPKEWLEFMDGTGIEWTVLYPSAGLAVGRFVSVEWAIAACRAYNNWLHERFVNATPRIKGMALIPVQDVEEAVKELRRAVKELGMCGAMLPSTGEGIMGHLGAKVYWPIYEEAEKLGCCLAVHGGCHHHLGLDGFSTYYPVHALGHPFGIMIQAAGMLAHGIFDRFPGIRVAFLEGGAAWVPFFMDRIDRSYNDAHLQVDREGELLVGPKTGEKASEYFKRHVREGRIFAGFDCDDVGLGFAVKRAGREPFLFASDFPHEVFSAESCRHEIDELLERDDLTDADKEAVLSRNADRLYRIGA
ncbi:MAG: amidohydrolase family protein [Deltaproteobacteria bacterium]|nr:amidohydrolase family protein [Deltaproteobacteria bacterium]MCZ6564036.1 amidohydrolase family protein [Deltaproteobacteria bacterium]MCZ6622346.1 amidohydrolase family protein [Deltaproteobacteria bacterium]MCZ6906969.1 amidohydrolase family protein [Deltaproteobacteria bacterium]